MPNELGGAGPTLHELLAEYDAGDDIGLGIDNAEAKTTELMRQYLKGVPSGVMFAGNTRASEWMTDLLASIVIEVAAKVNGWNKEEEQEQLDLTVAVMRLLHSHAMNVTLKFYQPVEEGQ